MKRVGRWVVGLIVCGLLSGAARHDATLFFFTALVSTIWLCVGVAWGARGTVRYLRR